MDIRRTSHLHPLLLGFIPVLVLLGSAAARFPSADHGMLIAGRVRLEGPTPARVELVTWGAKRYRAAGLELPAIELAFHDDTSGCYGNRGWTDGAQIDLCIRLAMEAGPQRLVLHELAHAWCNANLTEADRRAFDRLRGASTWNDDSREWKDRGTEQAAEILAWGLGDGTMLPLISGDVSPGALAGAFAMLTGSAPLHDASAAA